MYTDIFKENMIPPDFKPWKFKDLRVYSSTEWLADNRKKYRQVFDRYETAYIYAELSFYNKLHEIEDWEINVELRCFSTKKAKKEVCRLPFRRRVSKADPIGYIREGWGNRQDGLFWKRGPYYWEAWVEGVLVATKYFYIEDGNAPMTEKENPYFNLQSMSLYEGPYDDVPEFERTYLSTFNGEETRYVYAEVVLENKLPMRQWQAELFIKFFNNARELKGQVVKLQSIEEGMKVIRIPAGWGSNVKGSWRTDRYTVEVVFLDFVLATMPFIVGNAAIEGHNPMFLSNLGDIQTQPMPAREDETTFPEVLEHLDKLIGLNEIKTKVREHAKYIKFLQLRKEKGYKESDKINVHSIFVGNPGTGKTTVAKMMGRLYHKMGLLSKGHVHEVDRSDLVGEYIGQTAPKVKEAIEAARGGVLFIDEAYALSRSQEDNKDFGKEVIEYLVKEMSNGVGDLSIIVAGYPKEMKTFLDTNPGLRSRFKHTFDFSDYLPQELIRIAEFAAQEKEVIFTGDARNRVNEIITEAFRRRDRTFGNARFVYDLIEKVKIQMALRIMADGDAENLPKEELAFALLEDVLRVNVIEVKALPYIPVDEVLLHTALSELENLIGMTNIKTEIREMVNLVKFTREQGRDVLGRFFLHTVFVGNPGTGKTTVARILAKIYKALGVLERGQMVETDRQGLVAGYVGQTATKTSERIDEAMGGVLFIDEAYALTSVGASHRGDFGDEAIHTLLKRMEDDRGKFFIFVAGYPENMDNFLKANPGLASRFDKILRFEDYSPQELLQIALFMFDEENYVVTQQAREHLGKYFEFLHQFRDKFFGNARTVRKIVVEAIKNQNLRIAEGSRSGKTTYEEADLRILQLDDVSTFTFDKDKLQVFQRRGIGFGR